MVRSTRSNDPWMLGLPRPEPAKLYRGTRSGSLQDFLALAKQATLLCKDPGVLASFIGEPRRRQHHLLALNPTTDAILRFHNLKSACYQIYICFSLSLLRPQAPLELKAQYAKYRNALRAPWKNRLLQPRLRGDEGRQHHLLTRDRDETHSLPSLNLGSLCFIDYICPSSK
ncbi:hypothetical protein FPCIR_14274, partial [Fusarium pseudocircinatum]